MRDFIRTDDWQWQRKDGDTYEMYQIVCYTEVPHPYFVGGGHFTLSDFDAEDVEYALNTYGYVDMDDLTRQYGEDAERVLAECLFECNWADWDLESFKTLDEAREYVNKLMG